MKALPAGWAIPVFLLIVGLGTAILGPALHLFLTLVWPVPFHRSMDRTLLIVALVTLWVFRSRYNLGEWWPWRVCSGQAWLLGFLAGVVALQAVVALQLTLTPTTVVWPEATRLLERLALAAVAVILVPLLEESLFRGWMQGELSRALGCTSGLTGGAILYTFAHFLRIPALPIDHLPVHAGSGFVALGAAAGKWGSLDFVAEGGVNLLALGLLLGLIRLRTGNLWAGAGLHGALIMGRLILPDFLQVSAQAGKAESGGVNFLASPITTLVLLLLCLWVWWFLARPSASSTNGENAP